MKSVLITGANKGIGLATTKELLQRRCFVYLGSRSIQKGQEVVEELKRKGLYHVQAIPLDVTDNQSVSHALEIVAEKTQHLDVLINNAGINGGAPPYTAISATPEQFREAFETNIIGVASVTQAFLPLLKKSSQPRIVNVSTSVGSLSLQSDPTWPAYNYAKYAVYASSKAALNMYTVHLAYELRDTAFKVNAVCPGYTKTDFTGHNGGEVDIAAKRIARFALLDDNGPTGKFFSEELNPQTGEIPW
jgi:NAD(P)-dependent dehydrogenase (short-subunit alcohol dehydrogenase family)